MMNDRKKKIQQAVFCYINKKQRRHRGAVASSRVKKRRPSVNLLISIPGFE